MTKYILDIFPQQLAAQPEIINSEAPEIYKAAWYLVHDLFRHNSELHSRIWTAAAMLTLGYAFNPHALDSAAVIMRVRDFTQQEFFKIERPISPSDPPLTCLCTDAQHTAPRSDKQPLCIHILTYKLAKLSYTQPHPLPPSSPRSFFPWIQETGARFQIVGIMDRDGRFQPYPYRVSRQATQSEVVCFNDAFWRVGSSHHNQRVRMIPIEITPPSWYAPAQSDELAQAFSRMRTTDGRILDKNRVMTDLTPSELEKLLYDAALKA